MAKRNRNRKNRQVNAKRAQAAKVQGRTVATRSSRAVSPAAFPSEHKKSASQRAYEASSSGRRLGQWDAPALSPTQSVTSELDVLRRRSHAATRNNPWVSRAISAGVANEIGTGIIPRPATKDKEFNTGILELWEDFHPLCDISGQLGAYGMQWSASRGRKESGEIFIRIIRKRADRNLPVPLQFQILESDFCPTHLNKKTSTGNQIISGVEVNGHGAPVAYWIYKNHPSEGFNSLADLVRVKVEDMIHHFIPNRPGQLRGEPAGTQSMVRAYVFDKYDDAELGRKEARSHFTGVIRRPDYGEADYKFDPISGEPISEDDSDVPMIEMETGTFPNLLPGEDITLFDGDDAGRGYKDYQHYQLLGIAAGWDVPYQLVSGDYTEINDRLWRAIMNQYHREVEQIQDLFVIAQVCRRMWAEFVDRAILSGAIAAPKSYSTNRFDYLRAKHRPQAWKHIHPTQDVDAKVKEVEAGFTSRSKVVDSTSGESAAEIDEQRAEDDKREKELGLSQEINVNNGEEADGKSTKAT